MEAFIDGDFIGAATVVPLGTVHAISAICTCRSLRTFGAGLTRTGTARLAWVTLIALFPALAVAAINAVAAVAPVSTLQGRQPLGLRPGKAILYSNLVGRQAISARWTRRTLTAATGVLLKVVDAAVEVIQRRANVAVGHT